MPRISERQHLLAQLRSQIKFAMTLELLQEPELCDIITVADVCGVKPDDLLLAMLEKHEQTHSEDILMAMLACGKHIPSESLMRSAVNLDVRIELWDSNDEIDFLMDKYMAVKSQRYLQPRSRVARAPSCLQWLLETVDDRRFKQEARMSREKFKRLVNMIQGHHVFQNNSIMPQHPVEVQLLVALRSFGAYGNGASIGHIARYFRVSEGTVVNFTNRCIDAILSLKSDYLQWPTAEQRNEISRRVFERSGLPSCVGFVDGTLFGLERAPQRDGI